MSPDPSVTPSDPVAQRRARIKHVTGMVKRVGYLCLLGAVVTFVVALATDLASWAVAATIVLLVAACVILPAPIVIGYGIRAADREDREAARRRAPTERTDGGGHDRTGAP